MNNIIMLIGGLTLGYAVGFSWRDNNKPTESERFIGKYLMFIVGLIEIVVGLLLN